MLACGSQWGPTFVSRVVEPILSSTCVSRVVTDSGVGFIKGMGNPAGNESLAMELVGSELAIAIGLPVPDFAILDVIDIQIPFARGGTMDFGPAFISKELRGSPADPDGTLLDRISNPHDIALLVAFDTWIRNLDRCPPPDYLDPTPKWDNLFFAQDTRGRFRMMVLDHTHCFVEEDLASGLSGNHFVDDDRAYGVFPEFLPHINEVALRAASAAIARIDAGLINQIVQSVPLQWGPSDAVRTLWAERIHARGQMVEGYLMTRLVQQSQMPI